MGLRGAFCGLAFSLDVIEASAVEEQREGVSLCLGGGGGNSVSIEISIQAHKDPLGMTSSSASQNAALAD